MCYVLVAGQATRHSNLHACTAPSHCTVLCYCTHGLTIVRCLISQLESEFAATPRPRIPSGSEGLYLVPQHTSKLFGSPPSSLETVVLWAALPLGSPSNEPAFQECSASRRK